MQLNQHTRWNGIFRIGSAKTQAEEGFHPLRIPRCTHREPHPRQFPYYFAPPKLVICPSARLCCAGATHVRIADRQAVRGEGTAAIHAIERAVAPSLHDTLAA